MTKKVAAPAFEEEDEHQEFSLQDLLAASNQIDKNVATETELQEKEVAKEQFGLVEVGEVKPAKGGSSKVEKDLRDRVTFLEQEVVSVAAAWQERVTDLESAIAERDEQIQRLAAQLESSAEQSTETSDTGLPKVPPVPGKAGAEEPNPFANA